MEFENQIFEERVDENEFETVIGLESSIDELKQNLKCFWGPSNIW